MSEATSPREGLTPGQAVHLADLIEYQDASVVSRTLVDKPAATVTLFAFDQGQGLSEHTAPFDALVYVVEGQAQVTISGTALSTEAGQVLLMPANEPHALRAVARFKMLLVMVRS